MILSIIILFISLLLDGIITNVIKDFLSFFTISSLLIISLLNISNKKIFILSFIMGVIYDLTYMPSIFLSGFIFLFIIFLFRYFLNNKYNFIKVSIVYMLSIILNYSILILFTYFYTSYNFSYVISNLLSSFIIDYIYFIFLYLVLVDSNSYKKTSY